MTSFFARRIFGRGLTLTADSAGRQSFSLAFIDLLDASIAYSLLWPETMESALSA